MTRNEFLTKLTAELSNRNVADAADVVSEYEQHFAFKLADGYSEEEIAAKLGDPLSIASQYESGAAENNSTGRKITTVIGLCFADLFTGIFFVLLIAWEIVFAALAVSCLVIAVCLFGGINVYSLIPPMPYFCGTVYAVALTALAVLSAVGSIYFAAFIHQLMRSYSRFHHNAIAEASGKAVLPPVTITPQFSIKAKRRLRTIALISLTVFGVCVILAVIVSMLSSGALGFWHKWGWFV